jgi:outer membrane protein OmpA-like peptidoglycan-associated protein
MSARLGFALAAFVSAALVAPTGAAADPLAVGGWVGPRFYSNDSALGYIDTAPEHPNLTNGMVLGARLAKPIRPWLVPEVELPMSITSTDKFDVTVLWVEPRIHVRFEFLPKNRRVQPFVLVGAGAAFTVSSKSQIFGSDIAGDAYFGIGAHAITGRGFQIRGDFRIAIDPGIDKAAVLEFEAGIGLWVALGSGKKKYNYVRPDTGPTEDPDPDRDGILGDADKCPDRAEDVDDYEDSDGCPDIDNDLDHVLDIADKCPAESETYNGIDDDDGCPDSTPPEVEDLDGTIEGLTYSAGETSLNSGGRRSVKKLAKTLTKFPSVKIRVIGYTDDREAVADKPGPDDDNANDPAAAAAELSLERAAVVKAMLIGLRIRDGRLEVVGKGADDPVGDNDTKRGRAANRRVVVQRIVPAQ